MAAPSGGVTGALIRDKVWSATPLDPLGSWPRSLITTLGLLLQSGFPGCLFRGPDFICFYNDAFKDSMDDPQQHPKLLGTAAREGLSEKWPILKLAFDEVMKGKSFWQEDQPAPFFNKTNSATFGRWRARG